jgi:hypothetical protein
MAQFSLEIAGQVAAVTSLFESTPHHFSRYLTDRDTDFPIVITPDDLRFEQYDADVEAAEEGFRQRNFPEPFLERAAIQRQFAEHLLERNTILLHGSTLALDGKGYLFTARSGTGKSTHTRLWREVYGPRVQMVNDDKPFAQLTPSGITVWGSPWSGKHGLDTNIGVPLDSICLLERGPENIIRQAEPAELKELLKGFRPRTEAQAASYDTLLEQLLQKTKLWHLYCNKNPDAAAVAFEAMSK